MIALKHTLARVDDLKRDLEGLGFEVGVSADSMNTMVTRGNLVTFMIVVKVKLPSKEAECGGL